MPKAAIDKDRQPFDWEEEVGDAKHIACVQFPSSDSSLHQDGSEPPLGRTVPTRPDCPHVTASDWIRRGRTGRHGQ